LSYSTDRDPCVFILRSPGSGLGGAELVAALEVEHALRMLADDGIERGRLFPSDQICIVPRPLFGGFFFTLAMPKCYFA
jgi:hypothetical protein